MPYHDATMPTTVLRRLSSVASAAVPLALVLLSCLCPFGGALAAPFDTIIGTASVIDADTIEVHGARIRLQALDAIEARQRCFLPGGKEWRCGTDSANALAAKIGRAPVECVVSGKDRYKRFVARCFQNGEDLNGWLVSNGWAVAYRQYGKDYVPQETEAKAARRGIWVSKFVMPWEWRRGLR